MHHHRTCNLCEAMCGLEIELQDGQITAIRGDQNDPFSRGHICPKAVALKDIYEDPNRLKTPLRRKGKDWEPISWEAAMEEVVTKIQAIQAQYGPNAVALYQGNPSIHNLGTMMNSSAFAKALKTKNLYSATSVDQLPHHFASWLMFGHPLLIPIPDIDRTDFMLIFGGNPLASNGSMMSVPDVAHRLRAIQERGGQVVTIDPRRSETAAKASTHHFIKPGADVYLLLALLQVIFEEKLDKIGRLAEFTEGLEQLPVLVAAFSPERVSGATGMSASAIRDLARAFASAQSAVCYGRVGVSTQSFGGLCHWLINALNIVTGNLDREGGAMFTTPAIDILAASKGGQRFDRWRSRVRQLPEFLGELPVAALAEEILTPGEGQIRALVTSCGNPVLSTPNGTKLEKALEKLDFMVAIDIYLNESSRHADLILPPATGLENAHYDLTFHALAVRNTAKYSPALFAKAEGAKYDYEIYQALSQRLRGEPGPFVAEAPEQKLALGLQFGPYQLDFEDLKKQKHGIDLGPLEPRFPARLFTEDKRIQLCPGLLVKDLERAEKALQNQDSPAFNMQLIGRRHLRDNNSWMHNTQRLMRGRDRCTLYMHPQDAEKLNLQDQGLVKVSSRVGSIQLPLEITADMMPGVICMPHGYGHHRADTRLDVASQYPGASINDLTDETVLDELTGNAAFSNVWVKVERS
jgi:anaerobic selenocysteine-containing dehydrogenase